MSSNEELIRETYRDAREEGRAEESRYAALEFHYTKKHIREYIQPGAKVIELGCGTGYYAMCFSDSCGEYTGVDITPENIALFNQKASERGLRHVKGQIGDATKLEGIPDAYYDVVLCLGPLYHLPEGERKLVFAECGRICKNGGIAVFSYINQVGVYAGACVHDTLRKEYPSKKANRLVLGVGTDDVRPGLFFFTMPEEMEALASQYGFKKLKNLGTDFFVTMSVVEAMSEERFALMEPLLDQMASHESCTGMSNHALLVCTKQPPGWAK